MAPKKPTRKPAKAKRTTTAPESADETIIGVRVDGPTRSAWQAAADLKYEGNLSMFIRSAASDAARTATSDQEGK